MFRGTAALCVRYGGATPLGNLTSSYQSAVESASKVVEAKYPVLVEARIQGSTPHHSTKDPSDPEKIITVSYHTAKGTRALSIHVHEDGTFKEFLSRYGKDRLGGDAK